jgi:putative lipoic acid-binding regulatory protein
MVQLALFDLRFPGSQAAVSFEGHVNETFEQSMVRLVSFVRLGARNLTGSSRIFSGGHYGSASNDRVRCRDGS